MQKNKSQKSQTIKLSFNDGDKIIKTVSISFYDFLKNSIDNKVNSKELEKKNKYSELAMN